MRHGGLIATLAVLGTALVLSGCALTFRGPAVTTDDRAVLGGALQSLNEEGTSEQGTYWFEWGGTEGFVFKTPTRQGTFPAGQQNPVTPEQIQLQPARTYRYRLCGDTDGNVFCSAVATFRSRDPATEDYVAGMGTIWNAQGPTHTVTIQVHSGPSGENATGTYSASAIQGGSSVSEDVTCLRVTGRKAILGSATRFRQIEWLPEFSVWRLLEESLAGRDPSVCPAAVTSTNLQSIEGLGDFPYVEVNDAPAPS